MFSGTPCTCIHHLDYWLVYHLQLRLAEQLAQVLHHPRHPSSKHYYHHYYHYHHIIIIFIIINNYQYYHLRIIFKFNHILDVLRVLNKTKYVKSILKFCLRQIVRKGGGTRLKHRLSFFIWSSATPLIKPLSRFYLTCNSKASRFRSVSIKLWSSTARRTLSFLSWIFLCWSSTDFLYRYSRLSRAFLLSMVYFCKYKSSKICFRWDQESRDYLIANWSSWGM